MNVVTHHLCVSPRMSAAYSVHLPDYLSKHHNNLHLTEAMLGARLCVCFKYRRPLTH